MPHIIYKRRKGVLEPTLIGVCKSKDADAIVKRLNQEALNGPDTPELQNLRQQLQNLKRKIEELNAKRETVNKDDVPGPLRPKFTQLCKLANAEIDRAVAAHQKTIAEVESRINLLKGLDPPYYSRRVDMLRP